MTALLWALGIAWLVCFVAAVFFLIRAGSRMVGRRSCVAYPEDQRAFLLSMVATACLSPLPLLYETVVGPIAGI